VSEKSAFAVPTVSGYVNFMSRFKHGCLCPFTVAALTARLK
jgi:hypothetical protein